MTIDEQRKSPSPQEVAVPDEADQDPKSIREQRGLSLNDVFHATRVSLVNLEALEDGNFKALPPPVYTRNFIRKYARAVGVDEQPLLKRYERYLEGLNPPREEQAVQKPWPEASRRYRFLFGSLAAVIAAGILVYALILYDQTGREAPPARTTDLPAAPQPAQEPAVPAAPAAESTPQAPATGPSPAPTTAPTSVSIQAPPPTPPPATTAQSTVKPAAAPAAAPQPGSAPAASRPAAPDKPLTLVVEARELTWVRITEGKNPSQQVLLKPGEKIERTAADFFLLDIGNAGGVNLTFQGKSLGSLGKSGQVVHLRLPEQTAERQSP